MTQNDLIYCAIDTGDLTQACDLAALLAPHCGIKLGLEFFNAFGPQGIDKVLNAAPAARLFIDLKYHDIPNTVAGAVRSLCRQFQPAYINVHASGGLEMMRAAVNSANDATNGATKVLAVTLLTSLSEGDIAQIGYKTDAGTAQNGKAASNIPARVEGLARLAQESGMAGVVCSSHEIEILREACGHDFVLMVPGIRPAGSAASDQKRVMTPHEAVHLGATHLVIGRPITEADEPLAALHAILESVQ
ncbi:MAG: orotidine-5'-phosphate decarboxylase [Alphaproteobacteria bacterium]